jgi:FkbM family methyltransferase
MKKRNSMSFEVLDNDSRGLLLKDLGHPLQRRTFRSWNLIATTLPWDHIIDIGSNYGEMIFFSNINLNQRITAIEANPKLIPKLIHNLRFFSNKTIISKAISSQKGFVNFNVNESHSGKSAISFEIRGELVEAITLEHLLESEVHNSVLIKIDIEGGENDLINSILKFKSCNFLFFVESQTFDSEVYEKLLDGFKVFCIDSDIKPIFEVTKENSKRFCQSRRKGRNSLLVPYPLASKLQKIKIRPRYFFVWEFLGSSLYRVSSSLERKRFVYR